MSMTISISNKMFFLFFLSMSSIVLHSTFLKAFPASTTRIPEDSFLVVSLKIDAMLKKSKINQSKVWNPIIDALTFSLPELKTLFLEPGANGFNLRAPVQIFLRSSNSEKNPLTFGLLASIDDVNQVDQLIENFAESLGFQKGKGKTGRYQKKGIPLEFGRKGKAFHLIGVGPIILDAESSRQELDKLTRLISSRVKKKRFPVSLDEHFSRISDLSIYLDGSGIAKVVEEYWPEDRWKMLLPLFDPFFSRQFGLQLTSNIGSIKATLVEYSSEKNSSEKTVQNLKLLSQVPGDLPLVIRLSVPTEGIQKTATQAIDQVLHVLSSGKINKDTKLPGFDASVAELLKAPSGDFIFAGGHFFEKTNFLENGQFSPTLTSAFLMGMGVEKPLALKQLLAGLNSASSIHSLLTANQLELINQEKNLWLTSKNYLREIEQKSPIVPLSNKRKKILNQHSFALDLDVTKANQSIRRSSQLNFSQLKLLNIADDFSHLSMQAYNNELITQIKLTDSTRSGWEVIFQHIGQAFIDQTNQSIFEAIAQDNLNLVIGAVKQGALVNASDRFGHSPIHYAAYKGNVQIVDYLLNNGGDPNIRGRHESTPLHSAAWGRNLKVLELLLEDGADVDARTDEGETPGMTAALRGEQEILEILFALSADPHAKDIHGSNLIDLAAAGGHDSIVSLLREIGVNNQNPLHVAAGLGDIDEVKKLLKNGHSINARDSFGATPLLIATVSGKENIVDFLLTRRANPQISAKDGYNLMHGAAFSGKKSLVRKALDFDLDINSRYGPDGVTPVDVADEGGDALPFLRALGGKTAWELGRVQKNN